MLYTTPFLRLAGTISYSVVDQLFSIVVRKRSLIPFQPLQRSESWHVDARTSQFVSSGGGVTPSPLFSREASEHDSVLLCAKRVECQCTFLSLSNSDHSFWKEKSGQRSTSIEQMPRVRRAGHIVQHAPCRALGRWCNGSTCDGRSAVDEDG